MIGSLHWNLPGDQNIYYVFESSPAVFCWALHNHFPIYTSQLFLNKWIICLAVVECRTESGFEATIISVSIGVDCGHSSQIGRGCLRCWSCLGRSLLLDPTHFHIMLCEMSPPCRQHIFDWPPTLLGVWTIQYLGSWSRRLRGPVYSAINSSNLPLFSFGNSVSFSER